MPALELLLIDFVLGVLALECLLLWVMGRRRAVRAAPPPWSANLAAGACLLFALRVQAERGDWVILAALLAAAGALHLLDLLQRWRARAVPQQVADGAQAPTSG
jgi:thiol:disulfide interchange protein